MARGKPAYRVVEQLPRTQDELELAIGAKFLGALAHLGYQQLTDLKKGAEPADLECRDASGRRFQIQIVEALDQRLRQLQTMRRAYLAELLKAPGLLGLFSGCEATLVDIGDPPYLPPVGTRQGQACLAEISAQIRMIGEEAMTLPISKRRNRKVHVSSPRREISVLVTRREAPSTQDRVVVEWNGGGPVSRVDLPRDILPAAIRAKVAKHYSRVSERFVLLIYSVDTLFTQDEPDVKAARDLLGTSQHPFDEVWYLFPYADMNRGHALKIWPAAGPSAST